MDRAYLEERIASTKILIEAYEDAELALATNGGVLSYTIDTGQTRNTVTRAEISSVRRTIDSLYNRLSTLQARLYGGTTNVRPAW